MYTGMVACGLEYCWSTLCMNLSKIIRFNIWHIASHAQFIYIGDENYCQGDGFDQIAGDDTNVLASTPLEHVSHRQIGDQIDPGLMVSRILEKMISGRERLLFVSSPVLRVISPVNCVCQNSFYHQVRIGTVQHGVLPYAQPPEHHQAIPESVIPTQR